MVGEQVSGLPEGASATALVSPTKHMKYKKNKKITKELKDKILLLHAAPFNLGYREIAKRLGFHPQTIRYHTHRHLFIGRKQRRSDKTYDTPYHRAWRESRTPEQKEAERKSKEKYRLQKRREKNKRYTRRHSEHIREYNKRYYAKNREKLLEQTRIKYRDVIRPKEEAIKLAKVALLMQRAKEMKLI